MRLKVGRRAVFAVMLLAFSTIAWPQDSSKLGELGDNGLQVFYNRDKGQITSIDIRLRAAGSPARRS